MKTERLVLLIVGLLVGITFLTAARAESELKFPFTGIVTGNSVYVRSGPDINWFRITKLMKDNKVEVVGEETGWYKIVPPEGSFSWVSKAYVEKKEGNKGIVAGDRVSIRAGSTLTDRKTSIQMQANKGMEVTIIGEEGDWYKIVPPEGAYVWISAQYVKPVSGEVAEAATTPPAEPAKETTVAQADTATTSEGTRATEETTTTEETPKVPDQLAAVTTRPAGQPAMPGVNKVTRNELTITRKTTTQPTRTETPEGLGRFAARIAALDKALIAEMKKPLHERNLDALTAGYAAIAEQKENRAAAKYARNRLDLIKFQTNAQQGVKELETVREAYRKDVLKPGPAMPAYTPEPNADAVRYQGAGVLRPSLVFEGPLMPKRFRLFDPEKCRTVAYVEMAPGVDINMSQYVGMNVAVYGTSCFDAKLGFKVIKAEAFKLLSEKSNVTNSPSVIP